VGMVPEPNVFCFRPRSKAAYMESPCGLDLGSARLCPGCAVGGTCTLFRATDPCYDHDREGINEGRAKVTQELG
jgi:hypothetical protein